MKIRLTEKSRKQLYEQSNGTGIIFLKTRNNEMQIIEIYLDRNRKFRVANSKGTKLDEFLLELISEIDEEE